MPVTPMRALRVPDDIWDNAREVAAINDTSVSAMIVLFLKKLHPGYRPYNTATSVARKVTGPKAVPKHLVATAFKPGHVVKQVKVDKKTCTHPNIKTIPYGTFCVACGTRMA